MKLIPRLKRIWGAGGPWISFGATVGAVLVLYLSDGNQGSGRIVGFAESDIVNIGATEIGRITSINAQIGQDVAAGQVIVTLDPAPLDAEIAIAEAERTRLAALLPASLAAEEQRLEGAVEGLQRELAREQEELGRLRSEQKALADERARAQKLVEDKLAVSDQLVRLDMLYSAVKPVAENKPKTIELLKRQLAAAEKRRDDAREARNGAVNGALGGDLLVTTRELEQLRQRRAALVLRATSAGRVSQIFKRAGDVAVPGDPIVTTVSTQGKIVACVPESQALRVGTGDRAKLRFRGASAEPLMGTVVAMGPIVTELSLRCRRAPTLPFYGRDAVIALDTSLELVAGQAFTIEFDHTAAPATPPPAAQASAGSPKPLLVNIPAPLRSRSRLEPSGALWRPDLQRYVIVSDDTGQKDANDKSPWLFAMSRDGSIDPEPIPITGVAEINDLESIAAGEGGEVWVLSSQSYSKKGKRPPSRTSFLRLMPDGRGFRVDAELHFADVIEAAGSDVMSRLGLPNGTRDLEIEGMSYHRGALYLGLKTPLDAQGNALIWKLGDPRALFARKSLERADLSLWASARVDAEVDGKATPGGISELLFLPDGSLMIASTPSSAEGVRETGRLWHVATPTTGVLSPREVQVFPGLKPEGLSLSPTPGRITVVFDAGGDVPSWMEIPWPG